MFVAKILGTMIAPFLVPVILVRFYKNMTPEQMALFKSDTTPDKVKEAIFTQVVYGLYPDAIA